MARGIMGYTAGVADVVPMILYNDAYVARALTLDTTAFTDGACKAGTPIGADGTIQNGSDALGILLHDVYVERPLATLVYQGAIRQAVAEEHSGVTYAAEMMNALKNVVFFNNIET